MCIAIYHDAGYCLDEAHFKNSWDNNPDGGGFSYIDGTGQLQVFKTMTYQKMFETYYDAVTNNPESPFSVHFRIATHGSVNIDNCHPFRYGDKYTLIHNGIIPVLMDKKDKRSDTRVFVEEYMSRMPKGWLDDDYLFNMTEEFIGNSKLVILTTDPKADAYAYILNESQGDWNKEQTAWFSNGSYKIERKTLFGGSKWHTPSQLTLDNQFDQYTPKLGKCSFCDVDAVFDDVCYQCESCQICSMADEACKCYESIHDMTEEEWNKLSSEVPY